MKIVKIISILISIIVVIAVLLPVVRGADKAKESQKSATNENILERFKRIKSTKTTAAQNELSPLVKESQALSKNLNPPPPPPPPRQLTDTTPKGGTPGVATTTLPPIAPTGQGQYKLIATCVNESNPQLSLALFDIPGKGTMWVPQSGKVGYITIKEIKARQVVASNGMQTVNFIMDPLPVMPSLVKGQSQPGFTSAVSTAPAIQPATGINPPTKISATGRLTSPRIPPAQPTPVKTVQPDNQTRQLSAEDEASIMKFMNEIDVVNSTISDEQERTRKSDELLNKLFSDVNSLSTLEDNQADDDDNNETEIDVTDANNYIRRTPPGRTPPSPK